MKRSIPQEDSLTTKIFFDNFSSSTNSTVSTISSSEKSNSLTSNPSSSSTTSTTSISPLSRESISTPLSSTLEVPHQQNPIQFLPLQIRDEVIKALAQTPRSQKKLHLNGICLDDELIWLLIESNLEELLLQNCHFDPNGSVGFEHILKFLTHEDSSKSYSKFGVQYNNCMTQWILFDEPSNLAFNVFRPIASLLFILSGDVPQQSSSYNISSLIFLPRRSELGKPLSSECESIMKSIMSRPLSNLKHLLLKDINFGSHIGDLISISRSKLDLIYIWNCNFKSSDLIWSCLMGSKKSIESMHPEKISISQFAVSIDGHVTQVIMNYDSSFLMPNSPDLDRGLILSLEQDLSNSLSWDSISSLTLFPSEVNPPNRQLSSRAKQNLSFIMSHQCPNLKYLLLAYIDFGGRIEDFISISKLNLDLLYLWNCCFKALDPIWSALYASWKSIRSMHVKMIPNFQFAVPIDKHITQIVINTTSNFSIPNSPGLGRGLILSLEQDLPNSLSLDDVSLLALLPSKVDPPNRQLSFQARQNLNSIMGHSYPNLIYLLLLDIDFDDRIEGSIPILRLKLDLIYLWGCLFKKVVDPIWRSLTASWRLLESMRVGTIPGFQFAIPIDQRITQIVMNCSPSFLMPNSSDLGRGLVLSIEQNLPNGLSLDNISSLALFPSRADLSNQQSSPKSKQNLKSILRHQYPNLKYLLLMGINFDSSIGDLISISQLKLDVIFLRNCGFTVVDFIWSVLISSMKPNGLMHAGEVQSLHFTSQTDGHTTQIFINKGSNFLPPNSTDLVHGLILSLGQDFLNDPSLMNISFMVFLPSKMSPGKLVSSQPRQSPEFTDSIRCPMLKYLFLKSVSLNDVKEKFVFVQGLELEVHIL